MTLPWFLNPWAEVRRVRALYNRELGRSRGLYAELDAYQKALTHTQNELRMTNDCLQYRSRELSAQIARVASLKAYIESRKS